MQMTRGRWLWAGLGLAALGGAGLMLRPSAVDVQLGAVQRGPLTVVVEEQGQSRARARFTVAAPISGQLQRVALQVGDRVAAGATLAHMESAPVDPRQVAVLRADLAAAKARELEAGARLREAASTQERTAIELRRRHALLEQGLIGQELRDQFADAATAADAGLASARAALSAARSLVASATARLIGIDASGPSLPTAVIAPIGGQIVRVFQESARVVAAGEPLFEIKGDGGLELVIDVLTEDAVQIKPGAQVRVDNWGGEKTLLATVRLVEPGAFTKISTLGVEEQRVNVIADLVDAGDGAALGAGYRIEAAIVTWSADAVLQIPTSTLFRRQARWQVFRVEDGIARLRAVQLGHRSRDAAEVLDGLAEGDQLIVFPSDEISEGTPVTHHSSDSKH